MDLIERMRAVAARTNDPLLEEAAAALEAAGLREAQMHDAMRQATERLAEVARECEELRAACSDEHHRAKRLAEKLRRVEKVVEEFEGMTGAGYRYMAANVRAAIDQARGKEYAA